VVPNTAGVRGPTNRERALRAAPAISATFGERDVPPFGKHIRGSNEFEYHGYVESFLVRNEPRVAAAEKRTQMAIWYDHQGARSSRSHPTMGQA